MSTLDIVNSYYRACNQGGDLANVPLADHVTIRGPLGSVHAENLRVHTAPRREAAR